MPRTIAALLCLSAVFIWTYHLNLFRHLLPKPSRTFHDVCACWLVSSDDPTRKADHPHQHDSEKDRGIILWVSAVFIWAVILILFRHGIIHPTG